jgi:replicative DNA helicase
MNRTELERQILGQILFDNTEGYYALAKLSPESFLIKKNRELFTKMQDISKNDQEITILSLGEKFDSIALGLSTEVVTAVGIRTHVKMLREIIVKDKFIKETRSLLSNDIEIKDLKKKFEPLFNELCEHNGTGRLEHCGEITKRIVENIDKIQKGKILGVKTGFPKLDDDDLTLRNGELVILGARPSVGKSALAWQIAVNSRVNVAFFSHEMRAESLLMRQLAKFTNLSTVELRRKSNAQKALYGLEKLSRLPIWVDDSQGKSGQDIYRRAKRFGAVRDLGLVVVDYLQIMNFAGATSRREGVGDCAGQLKRIAQELNIPVLCISSIRRGQDSKKEPNMEDLKESGDIEFHADVIILLHRNLFQNSWETHLIKAKDRNGEVFRHTLSFEKSTTSFYEMTEQDEARSFLPDD